MELESKNIIKNTVESSELIRSACTAGSVAFALPEANAIYCEDCLLTMARMPDKCVDTFTDPKYNVGKNYGENGDNLPEKEYAEWIEKVLNELKRVSNSLTVYTPHKWARHYWNILGDDYKEVIITWRPAGAIRWGWSNQFAKLLTNGKPPKGTRDVWENVQMPGQGWFFRENSFEHPGYTSQDLTRRVIKFLCNGNIVYDPFTGTGTTLIEAAKAGKEWIGSEIEEKWQRLALKRIEEETRQNDMAFASLEKSK
jgi:DNA modification methylase